ncbi:plasminogen receptor (KT)-like [Clytia hemisphaerica]|uniref:Plasminogen receptor (KT) n=1 Tax=Clytia hemisphaerica TaxID=252671 RepID=A0A7M5UW42_9CNID|eukprot:TCONS_00053930-protein
MGLIASSMKETMEDNLKKQQDFMLQTQQMQLGRQIAMQHMMAKKQMSIQMARQREMFNWIASFTGTVSFFAVVAATKSKNPKLLAPILPLGFITAYQWDMAHGDKMQRIKRDAEFILDETDRTELPHGDLNLQLIDQYRTKK